MKRYGMVIGLRPEKAEEYKRLHAAAWPGVLKMIEECNIRNYSIYLPRWTTASYIYSATSSTTEPISRRTWPKWLPTRRPSAGGRIAFPARSRWRAARLASGGPAWKRCFTRTDRASRSPLSAVTCCEVKAPTASSFDRNT